jgi:hypothetical protein
MAALGYDSSDKLFLAVNDACRAVGNLVTVLDRESRGQSYRKPPLS